MFGSLGLKSCLFWAAGFKVLFVLVCFVGFGSSFVFLVFAFAWCLCVYFRCTSGCLMLFI